MKSEDVDKREKQPLPNAVHLRSFFFATKGVKAQLCKSQHSPTPSIPTWPRISLLFLNSEKAGNQLSYDLGGLYYNYFHYVSLFR